MPRATPEQTPGDGMLESGATAKLRPRALLALLLSLAVGVGLGMLFLWWSFPYLPTDMGRLGVLYTAFEDVRPGAEGVVFGNSVFMSGIDGRQLGEELDGAPLVWNAASTGQSLPEAYLLAQALPDSVRFIVVGMPFGDADDRSPLHPQKLNALYLHGLRPSERTRQVLVDIYGEPMAELLGRSLWQHVYESRWALRQVADHQVRRLLRSDLTLDRAARDLYHPQAYLERIDPEITARFLAVRREGLDTNGPRLPIGTEALAVQLASDAAAKELRIVFLFPPIHPALREGHDEASERLIRTFATRFDALPNAIVIDASRVLDEPQFVDDVHPTNEGAAILTHFLAEQMGER